LGVPGITEINSFGDYEKQYQVQVDTMRLQSYGLTLRDVLEAVERNNSNVGGAYIEKGSEQYLLRGIALVENDEDIGSFVEEAQGVIARDVQTPPGYYLTWGGTFENLQRASARLLIVVPLALFLIFVLLFLTFNSVK
jgi:Cu/Ag efflux pump CusA